jgi:hypothetical protein|tara:strand:- start:85 stop:381 length:297 start_codon:yes stop_codon:yes gene_type:complete
MKNCLVLIKDADEKILIPGNAVRFISATSDTNIEISFAGDDNGIGTADITVDSGKGDEVLKELGRILTETRGVYTVADDINSVFMPNVTACAAVAISA